MTAYAISQLLKYKGRHEVEIIVIDNNFGDGSVDYLWPFSTQTRYIAYPKDKLQSHGIAFDYALEMGAVSNDYFITIESDSFPTQDNWLDYYEDLINQGYDSAASLLKLSGGTYGHPCGAMYSKKVWEEAKQFCDNTPYYYYPNMAMSEGFACHLQVHRSIVFDFLGMPEDYIELAEGYKPFSLTKAEEKRLHYLPVVGPFHNGMGGVQESVRTYGFRTIESEKGNILLDKQPKLVKRIGCEPGQFLSYYMAATGKKVFHIPTETKWIDGKEGHQQEYTLMENGFKHIWGISAYKDVDPNDEIAKIKQALPEKLYETLPEKYKINRDANQK